MAEPARRQREFACQEVVELVSDYLEGVMMPTQMTAFEVHLNFCEGCFAFLDQVRTTTLAAGAVPEDEIPEEVMTKLLDAFGGWRDA